MPKTRKYAQFEEELRIARGRVKWYASMLTWALNHCQNTPAVLLCLIREKSAEIIIQQNADEKEHTP